MTKPDSCKTARKRCRAMETLIDDQLTESKYPARARDVIEDMCKAGNGVFKGPIIKDRPRRRWSEFQDKETGKTAYRLADQTEAAPSFRRVDFWHFFPDPNAQNMDDCEYTFERHLPNKKMLRRMAKDFGFYPPAIAKLLKEGPAANSPGASSDLNYMQELRSLESGAEQTDGVDAIKNRYVVWEYHGPLELDQIASMLRASGRGKDGDRIAKKMENGVGLEVPMVRIFFCNATLLHIDEDYLLDSGESLYSVATFEKGESTVLGGHGVPELMRNEQAMLNSAMRMMIDNAALAVGPQIVIDKAAIAPENGRWKLTPRKVWQWVENAASGARREQPFQTFNIPMNQEMLAAIVQLALRFIDEAVSMPLIAQGEQGAHVTKTSSGMSMLFNSANVGFRRVVKNWDDDVTSGMIARTYDFNMQFSEREDVKGDMKVEARGTSVLLVRELQAEQIMQAIREWSTHPILGVGFRAYHAMRLVLQAMSINPNDLLLGEEDYLQKLKQMSEQEDVSPEQVRAKASIEVATIDAESRKEVAGVNREIATFNMQTAFAKLASDRDMSLTQIEVMFRTSLANIAAKSDIEKAKIAAKERQMAAEIGVERQNQIEAQARGLEPTGSGGVISLGAERPAR